MPGAWPGSGPQTWPQGGDLLSVEFNREIRDTLLYLKEGSARTSADQSVGNTTFVDATGVAFPVGASETWLVQLFTLMQISANDLKTRWTVPSGATGRQWYEGGSAAGAASAAIGADLVVGVGGTADYVLTFGAVVVVSTTAGTVQWQFAEFASDATPVILRANAAVLAHRIA